MRRILIALGCLLAAPAFAGGGPLGIDQRLTYDDQGLWNRDNQTTLERAVVITEIVGALWNGGETRLGRTFWQTLDASALSAVTVLAAKRGFSRSRPEQTDDPDQWFQGSGHESFPSGEVALQASFVTPFIAEYHSDQPWIWALAMLPLYDAEARMKVQGHWQTDVLAGLAIGTAFGLYAHNRQSPLILGVLPNGFSVGLKYKF